MQRDSPASCARCSTPRAPFHRPVVLDIPASELRRALPARSRSARPRLKICICERQFSCVRCATRTPSRLARRRKNSADFCRLDPPESADFCRLCSDRRRPSPPEFTCGNVQGGTRQKCRLLSTPLHSLAAAKVVQPQYSCRAQGSLASVRRRVKDGSRENQAQSEIDLTGRGLAQQRARLAADDADRAPRTDVGSRRTEVRVIQGIGHD